MADPDVASKHGSRLFGNLTRRFRQCASMLPLIGCSAAPAAAPKALARPVAAVRASPPPPGPSALAPGEAPVVAPATAGGFEPVAVRPPAGGTPTTLEVDGFEPAVIHLATGSTPAPLFVVTHGAGGQAQWHCSHYQSMLGPSAALLCPAGKRRVTRDPARGYYYPDHLRLGAELSAAYFAMLDRHARDVSSAGSVYIGYSQGASMGVLAVAPHGEIWTRLALVEGGYDDWSPALAREYRKHGGQRVLLVCGTDHCRKRARQAVGVLERAGVAARLFTAAGAGHRPDGPVADRVRQGLVWLLQDDPRYEGVRSALTSASENSSR